MNGGTLTFNHLEQIHHEHLIMCNTRVSAVNRDRRILHQTTKTAELAQNDGVSIVISGDDGKISESERAFKDVGRAVLSVNSFVEEFAFDESFGTNGVG